MWLPSESDVPFEKCLENYTKSGNFKYFFRIFWCDLHFFFQNLMVLLENFGWDSKNRGLLGVKLWKRGHLVYNRCKKVVFWQVDDIYWQSSPLTGFLGGGVLPFLISIFVLLFYWEILLLYICITVIKPKWRISVNYNYWFQYVIVYNVRKS